MSRQLTRRIVLTAVALATATLAACSSATGPSQDGDGGVYGGTSTLNCGGVYGGTSTCSG